MELQVDHQGDTAVLHLGGDLVAATAADLRPRLRALTQDGVRELVFDLAGTNMVDSSGIGLLMAAHNSMTRTGGTIRVIHASPEIQELFQSMRLNQHFAVAEA